MLCNLVDVSGELRPPLFKVENKPKTMLTACLALKIEAEEYSLFLLFSCFLRLFFEPEDGGTMFLGNSCELLLNNKTPSPMRQIIY
jgi:hypothetical protein